jgi:hypothetical protein
MPADIAERAQRPGAVANHDDGFTNNLHREKGAGIGNGALCPIRFPTNLVERAHQLPGSAKDAFFFQR